MRLNLIFVAALISLGLATQVKSAIVTDSQHFGLICPVDVHSRIDGVPQFTHVVVKWRVDTKRGLMCFGDCTQPPIYASMTSVDFMMDFVTSGIENKSLIERYDGRYRTILYSGSTIIGIMEGKCVKAPYLGIDESEF